MKTLVEGYQVTATGERKLGYGEVQAAGGKAPAGHSVPPCWWPRETLSDW